MKYMGSKERFAKELLSIMLNNRNEDQWYVEPFAGGMNMICHVTGNRIANDINPYLIAMWKELMDGWKPSKIDKAEYVHIKSNKELYPPHIVGWTGFNCSYSGKWFGGFAGFAMTKIGTIRDYQQEAINNVNKQVPRMIGVLLNCTNYYELDIPKNSIIYCDPPYRNTTKYSNSIDHDHFWQWCRDMVNEGHTVYISEYDAPDDFICIWQKEAKSSLSANGIIGASKTSIEKLFTLKK